MRVTERWRSRNWWPVWNAPKGHVAFWRLQPPPRLLCACSHCCPGGLLTSRLLPGAFTRTRTTQETRPSQKRRRLQGPFRFTNICCGDIAPGGMLSEQGQCAFGWLVAEPNVSTTLATLGTVRALTLDTSNGLHGQQRCSCAKAYTLQRALGFPE